MIPPVERRPPPGKRRCSRIQNRLLQTSTSVDRHSSAEEKIALFRSLFAGREDVYALRWENQRTAKSGWGPAVRGGWANARRPDREYLPYTDDVIERHLASNPCRPVPTSTWRLLPRSRLATSMARSWSWIRSRISTLRMPVECPQYWNVPDLATAAMSGPSLTTTFRPHPPDASACTSSARQ